MVAFSGPAPGPGAADPAEGALGCAATNDASARARASIALASAALAPRENTDRRSRGTPVPASYLDHTSAKARNTDVSGLDLHSAMTRSIRSAV